MNRLLHISVRADVGGGPKHVLDLLQGTIGWQSFVACPDGYALSSNFKHLSNGFFSIPHRRFSIISLIRLALWATKLKINLIHSHGRGAGIYSRSLGLILRIPVVHTHHGLYLENSVGLRKYLLICLERILNFLTCKVIFVSNSELTACREVGALSPNKSVVISNGVRLSPISERRPHSRALQLLAITRLDKEKDNASLIKVVKTCELLGINVGLRVAGDGPERRKLEDLTRELQVENLVTFLGNCSNIGELINDADVYVTCSLGEAHSIAMIEAMAGGLAVVATNVRGHSDMVENGVNGYLFSPGDYEAAASIIRNFALDRKHLLECGINARKLVEKNYSHDQMITKVLTLYKEIVSS